MSDLTCWDNGPHDLMTSHGHWWLTLWVPVTRTRILYIGAATGARWTPEAAKPFTWLRVSLSRRKPWQGRPSLSVHRWCAHIRVTHNAGVDQ